MSQTAQYEGARPSKVNYPVVISNRLFKDSEIGKDLPCQHCYMIKMGEMVWNNGQRGHLSSKTDLGAGWPKKKDPVSRGSAPPGTSNGNVGNFEAWNRVP